MRRIVATLAVAATVATACAAGSDPDGAAAGVTDAPCPEGDADHGCLYLAVLSDLTEGPFWPFGAAVASGVEAFWTDVNAAGGIDGYDVDVTTYTRDTGFDPERHAAALAEVADATVAVALSLGTEPTLAALDGLRASHPDLVLVPGSFWSGWWADGRVLPSGADYCAQVSNALDRSATAGEGGGGIAVVHFDDLYGRDVEAGVVAWADANATAFDPATSSIVTSAGVGGTQDEAVLAVIEQAPETLVVATGPLELASLVAKLDSQGFDGRVLAPAVAFTPGVLDQEGLADPVRRLVTLELPWQPWGAPTIAHRTMGRSLGGDLPQNDGFTFGWVWSYPLLALLEAGVEAGDLSPSGLAAIRDTVAVDYDGALPDRILGGDRHVASLAAVPDPEAPLGVRSLGEAEVGATVARPSATPCSSS